MTKTLLTLGALLCLTPSLATHYQLEPEHTNARFYIDHFQTSTNHGGFYGLTGHVTYDPDHEVGSVTVIIPIKNLKSGSDAFDQHLKNSDLFDAAKYPEMRFTSTQWGMDFFVDKGMSKTVNIAIQAEAVKE